MTNPVITKDHVIAAVPDAFHVADPFYVENEGTKYLFYEVFRHLVPSGTTADLHYSTSEDGLTWTYGGSTGVLSAAYPHVFKVDGQWYMAPHHSAIYKRLYRCLTFPTSWAPCMDIRPGTEVRDGTFFQFNNHWYLTFSDLDYLRLWHSPYLYGYTWEEHPASPLSYWSPDNYIRPGGRPIVHANSVDIFQQDGNGTYGTKLRVFRLSNLSPTTCTMTELANSPIIELSGVDGTWNEDAMHQLDRVNSGLSFVDGKYLDETPEDVWSIGIYRDVPE